MSGEVETPQQAQRHLPPRPHDTSQGGCTCNASVGAASTQRKQARKRSQGDPLITRMVYGLLTWFSNAPQDRTATLGQWAKLSRAAPSPLPRFDVTVHEVRQHDSRHDCWVIFHNKVYDVTEFLRFHPGGPDMLFKAAGRDCTSLVLKYHPWVNLDTLLAKHLVGYLEGTTSSGQQQPHRQASLAQRQALLGAVGAGVVQHHQAAAVVRV